ncbi:hypothetical protein PV342_31295 [Streptomyces sp. PA03-3a]|uniref:hypothetical protein n=1 Tax=Actinacidiphila glaucinigra TaxID=235986 RepID=UPI0029B22763|nr:hypothetical protein [Streptomyces sp. PA03-3a]
MSLIKKAFEVIEKGFDAGGDAIHDFTVNRRTAELFLKLGVAVYAEQRLGGSHEPVEKMFEALEGHVAENGEVELDHLKEAREVLGEAFVAKHTAEIEAEEAAEAKAVEEAKAAAAAAAAVVTPAAPVAAPVVAPAPPVAAPAVPAQAPAAPVEAAAPAAPVEAAVPAPVAPAEAPAPAPAPVAPVESTPAG